MESSLSDAGVVEADSALIPVGHTTFRQKLSPARAWLGAGGMLLHTGFSFAGIYLHVRQSSRAAAFDAPSPNEEVESLPGSSV
ncbi:hypothetical protein BV20DRAFT_54935 [Pilatotrama ljubarskyi]|nr:hypothetical protein BV20DRAFT_54935 [Pilatotrama ljubarskyi]